MSAGHIEGLIRMGADIKRGDYSIVEIVAKVSGREFKQIKKDCAALRIDIDAFALMAVRDAAAKLREARDGEGAAETGSDLLPYTVDKLGAAWNG